jgi:mannose-6-phosphate isomerase
MDKDVAISANEVGVVYQRPWGSYQTLALETGFQVKILRIAPKGKLSLQRHFKRAEHWVVVQGEPSLTIGDNTKTYQRNDCVFIPVEAVHRIENKTEVVCLLVEVQVGDYLGEDDIERLDDVYGRV